jgi:predicted DNA-binding protein YlxM (UPF0122 family)
MLTSKQKKAVELLALGNMTQKEIAQTIKVSEHTICDWKKNDDFVSEVDFLIRKTLRSAAAKALYVQLDLLNNAKNEMVKYLVSKDILDRTGYKPDDIVKIENPIPQVVIIDDFNAWGDDDESYTQIHLRG